MNQIGCALRVLLNDVTLRRMRCALKTSGVYNEWMRQNGSLFEFIMFYWDGLYFSCFVHPLSSYLIHAPQLNLNRFFEEKNGSFLMGLPQIVCLEFVNRKHWILWNGLRMRIVYIKMMISARLDTIIIPIRKFSCWGIHRGGRSGWYPVTGESVFGVVYVD